MLAVVALWLAVDNPSVSNTSRGDHACLAPWDTVLNDADNSPGGELPPDADAITARCREAGERQFNKAIAVAATAGAVALAACAVGVAHYRRDRRPRV